MTIGKDLSQLRAGALLCILATLFNLVMGSIPRTIYRSVNIAAATRQPDVALDLLGIPRGLCK